MAYFMGLYWDSNRAYFMAKPRLVDDFWRVKCPEERKLDLVGDNGIIDPLSMGTWDKAKTLTNCYYFKSYIQ